MAADSTTAGRPAVDRAVAAFAPALIAWQERHGRHDLPWQNTRDPYAVWLSEIMLQQTQVTAVIPYYRRFLERFPTVAALAAAAEDDVLALWSGLGYYSRARNLHRAARLVVERHGGRFPGTQALLEDLPGIGRSTAAAILVFAFGGRAAILDGNVKRVLARLRGIEGYPGETAVAARLWRDAEALLPESGLAAYTQGLMDLGATVCTRRNARCDECPVRSLCAAFETGRVVALPTPKPRKALPQRRTMMLVLQRAGEILLEKRPPAGIWGGLWCFPEEDPGADPVAACARRFGAKVVPGAMLPVIAHGFTHFKLDILPQPAAVKSWPPRAEEAGRLWISPEDALRAALPTPVRDIIMQLIGHRDGSRSAGA
ncbi:MAG: A/G-specific adenine glycosylase [Burkholderiales bacterium]|nr:A/G-specific adenine glycosylase [Burkholderiales bacterium]